MGLGTKQFWGDDLGQTGEVSPAPAPAPGTRRREALKCPRCASFNTKFCYYNNYNKSQPRHYCKSCKRHWTRGGTLRNVPVGGGGKNKRPLKIGDQKTLFRSSYSPTTKNYSNKTNPGLNGSHQNSTSTSTSTSTITTIYIDDVGDPTYNYNNQSLISYDQYATGNILDSLEESSIITSSASINNIVPSWEWDWNEIDAFMNKTTNNY